MQKVTMVIPTYWQREREVGWQKGDAVYDHPTHVDEEGTLQRTLESIKILDNKNFKLVLLVCPTADDIETKVLTQVNRILEKTHLEVETYVFTPRELREIKGKLKDYGLQQEGLDLLQLNGYSNVRNGCLFVSHLLSSDVTILIDDDEVFENPEWVDMATEFMGKRMYGKSVYGVAGYYLNKKDEYYDDVTIMPWMTYWDRFGSKAKAFDKIISSEPRLKVTPFAFGGAMVIHKNMSHIVAFDPNVTRGEDIDYLMNAKMFGFDFFLDNKLNIKHLPPKKHHPIWRRFREDIYRFYYQRSKIQNQVEVNNMTMVTPKDFMPYPGDFLTDDLEDKIFKTNVLLALDYLGKNDIESSQGAIENIYLSKFDAVPKNDTFIAYRMIQKAWEDIVDTTLAHMAELRKEMEKCNFTKTYVEVDDENNEMITRKQIKVILENSSDFETFSSEEIDQLIGCANLKAYRENETIFKKGSPDDSFFVILKGRVRIVRFNKRNEEILLGIIRTHGLVGETAIVNDVHFVDAIADEFVEIFEIKQDVLEDIIEKNPRLGNKILFLFLGKLHYKLDNSNNLIRDYVLQGEHLSDMMD